MSSSDSFVRVARGSVLALVLLTFIGVSLGNTREERELDHDHSSFHRHRAPVSAGETKPSTNGRFYAPDRKVDVLHLKLDVTPDFKKREVTGKTELKFKPIGKPLKELTLHAYDLRVAKIEASGEIDDYQNTDREIIITFKKPIKVGAESWVRIHHSAKPRKGLYFRTPEMGYKKGDKHIWTQGETHEGRHWFPSFDYPNEKFTSEVICRVPKDMIVLSNGKKMDEKIDPKTKLKAVRYLQDKPHVNYLIALVAGYHKKIEGEYRGIKMAFYTPPSQIKFAKDSFKDTIDMMKYFEKEIGVKYPWDRYDQVVVDDFNWGGMENTTLTILNDYTLHPTHFEPIRSSQNLVAHELVHQWFGDLVTCKDWSQIWLNEGFATYYAHLYDGHKNGHDSFIYGLYRDATRRVVKASIKDHRPLVYKDYKTPGEQFDYRAYPKGSWVLHMLRNDLGPALYRRCVKTFVQRHRFQSVVTQDLQDVVEELSGRSYQQFFDQWVYRGGVPQLRVSYSWDQTTKLARVTVKQVQKITKDVHLYKFPTQIRFTTKNGSVTRDITISKATEDFYTKLKSKPTVVRFDPTYRVLAEVAFPKPNEMLFAQLKDQKDVIGRLLALEALVKKKAWGTEKALGEALVKDKFWAVGQAAARGLGKLQTREALETLAKSLNQKDRRVKLAVIEAIGGYFSKETPGILDKVLASEKNELLLEAALVPRAKFTRDGVDKVLTKYLKSESYKHRLASAAVRAIRTTDDAAYLPILTKRISEDGAKFTTRDLGAALQTIGYLGRQLEDKTKVRQFLTGYLQDARKRLIAAAINALGDLRDAKAIPAVQSFANGPDDDRVTRAAKAALTKLRDTKSLPVEVRDLRSELMKIKEQNEALKKDSEQLKKKLDALKK